MSAKCFLMYRARLIWGPFWSWWCVVCSLTSVPLRSSQGGEWRGRNWRRSQPGPGRQGAPLLATSPCFCLTFYLHFASLVKTSYKSWSKELGRIMKPNNVFPPQKGKNNPLRGNWRKRLWKMEIWEGWTEHVYNFLHSKMIIIWIRFTSWGKRRMPFPLFLFQFHGIQA